MDTYLHRKLSTYVLKLKCSIYVSDMVVNNRKYVFVFHSDILDNVSLEIPNTI